VSNVGIDSIRVATALLAVVALSAAMLGSGKRDELAQIKALEDALEKAVNARDLDGVMAAYAVNVFAFGVAPPRQYVSATSYRDSWKNLLAGPISYRTSDLAIETHGSVAFGHKVFHATGTDGSGHAFDFTARVTDVYHKIDDTWRIVQEHVSVPVDVASGKADLASAP